MSFRIRPVTNEDFKAIYEMAKLTGGGFTNLPPDRGALVEKIIRSEEAFARTEELQTNDCFMMVLENAETGQIRGTCQMFGMVGTQQPFYSYRISTLTQTSKELGRTFRAEMLTLVTDMEGSSEVGGLFLHPGERAGGLGLLLARSRYLFIRQHRQRFGNRLIAELRGVIDEAGGSAFWDAIAGRFFGMGFQEADEFNGTHGTQFIADLMPKTPVYTAMLPESARGVMGLPHPSGRAAMKMLEREGFAFESYIDIFDGGPTMIAQVDKVRTVRDAAEYVFAGTSEDWDGEQRMISTGRLGKFRACYGYVSTRDGTAMLDPKAAELLEIKPGAPFLAIGR
ncbi:arginine N-succinyltransferase [Allosphingosinicella vermicomposti]|uniref:arginine N-succinyltransferase n=1 Tax=Allosphingosinicella vermicomposti TaxID=614671 RepID=UPI000D10AD15|nr:arginine N-succinyltransferase [Allosphingosinicella vermicomposti]